MFEPNLGFVLSNTKNIGMKEIYVCEFQFNGETKRNTHIVNAIRKFHQKTKKNMTKCFYLKIIIFYLASPASIEKPIISSPEIRPLIRSTITINCTVNTILHVPYSLDLFHPAFGANFKVRNLKKSKL